MLLYKKLPLASWAKLAPRELYLNNPFPEGVKFEDIYSIPQYVAAPDSFCVVREAIYGYVMRAGSCVWSKAPKFTEALDQFHSINVSRDGLAKFVDMDAKSVAFYDALMKVRLHDYMTRVEDEPIKVKKLEKQIHADVRRVAKKVLFDDNVNKLTRIRVLLYAISPKLLDFVFRVYQKEVKGL